MAKLLLLAAFAFVVSFAAPAGAQTAQSIPVTDPAQFATSLANRIATGGMEPIRETIRQMYNGGDLDVQNEAAITAYVRYLESHNADRFSKLEDMTLGDAIRRIYYLHSFGGRLLFTRLDFALTGSGWLLTAISYGSSWSQVATPSSPGWTPSE